MNEIKTKIYTIRNKQVMLDSDLAKLYDIATKFLNLAVKRNIKRFPNDFMFQLTEDEFESIRFQNGTLDNSTQNMKKQLLEVKCITSQNAILNKNDLKFQIGTSNKSLRLQNATLEKGRGKHKKYLPYVFTEQGVAMLSGILRSEVAINVNIQIMRAFIEMRHFLQSNSEIFTKIDNLETKQIQYQIKTDNKIDELFNLIQEKDIKPNKGIFFDGQVFDAYKFINDLIKSAKQEIILIDNYIDESVLTLFSKTNVNVIIYTKEINKQLKLDLAKYNQQYNNIQIKEFNKSHDRFLIIDKKEMYLIGASLKHLGRKWFGFSKFEKEAITFLDKL